MFSVQATVPSPSAPSNLPVAAAVANGSQPCSQSATVSKPRSYSCRLLSIVLIVLINYLSYMAFVRCLTPLPSPSTLPSSSLPSPSPLPADQPLKYYVNIEMPDPQMAALFSESLQESRRIVSSPLFAILALLFSCLLLWASIQVIWGVLGLSKAALGELWDGMGMLWGKLSQLDLQGLWVHIKTSWASLFGNRLMDGQDVVAESVVTAEPSMQV